MTGVALPEARAPRALGAPRARAAAVPLVASLARWWSRVGERALIVVLVLVLLGIGGHLLGGYRAASGVADGVAGHVMLEPGQSLWQVARETAPAGVDPVEHLRAIHDLNRIDAAGSAGWTVVLLPAY